MFKQVAKLIAILERGEKLRLVFVMLGSVFFALIEVVGIGSIMPFMSVASNPDIIRKNIYLANAYNFFQFQSDRSFIIVLGLTVIVFMVISNTSMAIVQYMTVRFSTMRKHTLLIRLFTGYLGRPYSFFLNRNSHELIKNVTTEINMMVSGTLVIFIQLITKAIQVALIVGFLVIVNPAISLLIAGSVSAIYGVVYFAVRSKMKTLGEERFELTAKRSELVSEAFWGIKDVKLLGKEGVFIETLKRPSRALAKNESTSDIVADLPKYALETVAFSSVMAFVLIMLARSGNFQEAIATVSVYLYASYRLMPAVQNLFRCFTKLRYGAATTERLLHEFEENEADSDGANWKTITPPLPLQYAIRLEDISFSYPTSPAPVIKDINLNIPVNSIIGFAGTTGSGKTTLVDIILCLLKAQEGKIFIDDIPLGDKSIRSWQRNIGYVPQSIYLSSESVACNIAFGVRQENIDMAAVETAARLAHIHDFIVSEMPAGYASTVGERGVRLSGGQRQRIGIARALYHNPAVLVLDEATSALDGLTEETIMEAIETMYGSRTIIMIAHRLSTLRKCDQIILLEKGRIVDSGKYDELRSRNKYFKRG